MQVATSGGSANSVEPESNDILTKPQKKESEDVELPEFFPTDLTEDQIISFKKTAAQKRQDKRDARRARDNPDRSQDEENKERARKTQQSRKRDNDQADAYSGGGSEDYGRNREAKRAVRCEGTGENCQYSGPNQSCYNDCLGGFFSDKRCAQKCKYINTVCYEDCRVSDSIGNCLDDCQRNVDRSDDNADDNVDDNVNDDGDLRRDNGRRNKSRRNGGSKGRRNKNKGQRNGGNNDDRPMLE